MSAFKTKKLPKKIIEGGKIEEKLPPKVSAPKKGFFGIRFWIGSFLVILSIVFISQIASVAFQGNEKNGSEVYVPITIKEEEYVTEKVLGTTNFLIAGIGGKGHNGSDLTDSIMLASLDEKNKIVTLLSIPRDLYVAYPKDRGGAGRINTLYDLGKRDSVGIKYLADKVTEITGQTIDHYFVIDFSGFKKVIDILGGVEIDVPEDLIDREYPDNNWGYTTFSVKAGPQIFDGETALKYARSRHSTSDFDRSNRQQLIIKGIKERASELGFTNVDTISEIYDAILANIDTDLSIANMADIALAFSDVKSSDIRILTLSNSCFSLTKCAPGGYLYSPSRDLFGGSSVVIPENAYINKLSYYTDIRKFVDITFRFPGLHIAPRDIVFVADPTMRKRTQEIGLGLAKYGFPISFDKSLIVATGAIEKSRINIYWNSDMGVGIDPEGVVVSALRYLEESIPYVTVEHNEFANSSGPKIEIIIGKDGKDYFTSIIPLYYIPSPPKTLSGKEDDMNTVSSGSRKNNVVNSTLKQEVSGEITAPSPLQKKTIQPGEWENF